MRPFDLRPTSTPGPKPAVALPAGAGLDAQSGLAQAQATVLRAQLPLFYLILLINVGAAAWSHLAVAPRLLSLSAPAILLPLCLFRAYYWRRRASLVSGDRAALAQMARARREVAPIWLGGMVWSVGLLAFGTSYLQCQMLLFIDANVLAGMFLLLPLRRLSAWGAVVGLVSTSLFLLGTREPALGVMALDSLLVGGLLALVAQRMRRNLVELVVSRNEIAARSRETQRLSDENLRIAHLDSLSGLPNRRRFFADLDRALKQAEAEGRVFTVALLDLDRFRMVNDVYGHAAGDRLLTQIATRLQRLAGESVSIARLGGDQFGAILTGSSADAGLALFGVQVKTLLAPACVVGDKMTTISASIGGAIYPQAGDTAADLFEHADYALYHAKQTSRGNMVLFTPEFETRIRRDGLLEQTLRGADLEAEFSLAFQPVIELARGRIVAFEALARWNSPSLGPIAPDQFIQIAERTQTIGRLTTVLFAKALAAAQDWPADISLCFNLSAHDIIDETTMAEIGRLIAGGGVSPARLEFEITETALFKDYDRAAGALAALHRWGVRVSLDDFGTGFSSLGYVHRLPLDKIKIDRSFVADVDASDIGPSIIKTIIDLCRNLGFACVVEGVETESQLRVLKGLGCRLIQGYHFSRPVAPEAAAQLIARFNEIVEPCVERAVPARS